MTKASEDFELQLRDANEQLYKHSHDLSIRNKTLSLLRRLYQISIKSLSEISLAEEITENIRTSLDLELVGIFDYEAATDTLIPVRFSTSDRIHKANTSEGFPLQDINLSHASKIAFLETVFIGSAAHTSDVRDLWQSSADEKVLEVITSSGHIRNLSVHPLQIEKNLRGVLVLALNRPVTELSEFEIESIESLVDVVAVALDRVHLYEQLKQANEEQVVLIDRKSVV